MAARTTLRLAAAYSGTATRARRHLAAPNPATASAGGGEEGAGQLREGNRSACAADVAGRAAGGWRRGVAPRRRTGAAGEAPPPHRARRVERSSGGASPAVVGGEGLGASRCGGGGGGGGSLWAMAGWRGPKSDRGRSVIPPLPLAARLGPSPAAKPIGRQGLERRLRSSEEVCVCVCVAGGGARREPAASRERPRGAEETGARSRGRLRGGAGSRAAPPAAAVYTCARGWGRGGGRNVGAAGVARVA